MIATILLLALQLAPLPTPWHYPLCLANGGIWRQRVPIAITNAGAQTAAGTIVAVKIGRGPGEADLAGADSAALRVCNERGAEMIYGLITDSGAGIRRGPIPAGATLTLPAECAAGATATYYVYFDNSRAWAVPDYLTGDGLRNGGVESGEGDTPDGWQHDAPDPQHRASWTTETSHTGKRCLKTWVADGAEPTWISTRQSGIRIVGGAKYVMTAWVKAQDVVGESGWYIHVGSAATPMMISPMLGAGSGTFDWKEVRAGFTAPADADSADLGTVLRGAGTAWFDDVTLTRVDGEDVLTARAGPREKLDVRELGADPSWRAAGSQTTYRIPIRVANLSDQRLGRGLVSVDLATILGRLQGKASRDSIRVMADGRVMPHYLLGDALLFAGDAPARSVRTYYACLSPGSRGASSRRTQPAARAPAAYAPNPAIPGGETRGARQVDLQDYAALLASPRNLARNPSFEDDGDLPAVWAGGAEGQRPAGTEMRLVDGGLFGKRCGMIHVPTGSTPAWVGWRQSVRVKPRHTYLYAAWLKCRDLQGGLQIHAHLLTEAGALTKQNAMTGAGPAIAGTQGWTLISGTFTTPEDCAFFEMHLTMLATGTAWHDGVLLVEVAPGEAGMLESRAVNRSTGVAVWPVNAVVKVFREDAPPARVPAARITCARNEHEPLQVAVRSSKSISGVRASVSPIIGPGGAQIRDVEIGVVGYVPIDHVSNYYSTRVPAYYRKTPEGGGGSDGWAGWWPDPLLPRSTFDLAAGVTQPVWVTVAAAKTAPPGDYHGTVRLTANGAAVASLPFTVHVWAFAIPETRSLKAVFDTRQSSAIWQVPGQTEEQTRIRFWRFLADRRVCPDQIQPEPTFTYRDGKVTADFAAYDRAGRIYFDEMKFPHSYAPLQFYAFGWANLPADRFGEKPYEGEYPYAGVDRSKLRPEYKRAYEACLKAYWDHVKAMGWADRITLYISDEPYDGEAPIRAQMKALCDMVHEVDPSIPIYSSTWHHQPEWDGYITVWGFGHYGLVPVSTMERVKAGGATIWWTTDGQMCTDTPYCAIERLLPHYCFAYGAKAYEFWGCDWLTYDPYQYGWHSYISQTAGPGQPVEWVRYPNGDGFLAYPPGPLHLDHAVSSIRLEQAREGEEDYEYLHLLAGLVARGKSAGRDVSVGVNALATASGLVTSPCEIGRYSTRILPDPDRVFRVKEAVARAIEHLRRL